MIESKVLAEYRRELERLGSPPPEVGDRQLDGRSEDDSEKAPPADDSGEGGTEETPDDTGNA
jgi:hypothetical protein